MPGSKRFGQLCSDIKEDKNRTGPSLLTGIDRCRLVWSLLKIHKQPQHMGLHVVGSAERLLVNAQITQIETPLFVDFLPKARVDAVLVHWVVDHIGPHLHQDFVVHQQLGQLGVAKHRDCERQQKAGSVGKAHHGIRIGRTSFLPALFVPDAIAHLNLPGGGLR